MVKGKAAGQSMKGRQSGPKASKKTEAKKAKAAAQETEQQSNGVDSEEDDDAGSHPKDHNERPPLSPDERQALGLNHMRILEAAMEGVKEANKIVKDAEKRIKAEGNKVKQIKMMIQLRSEAGQAKMRDDFTMMQEASRWMGATQMEMFGDIIGVVDRTPAEDRAFEQGRFEGGRAENPESYGGGYAPGSPQYNKWIEGYRVAQTALASCFRTPLETAIAEAPDAPDEDFEEVPPREVTPIGDQPTTASKAN